MSQLLAVLLTSEMAASALPAVLPAAFPWASSIPDDELMTFAGELREAVVAESPERVARVLTGRPSARFAPERAQLERKSGPGRRLATREQLSMLGEALLKDTVLFGAALLMAAESLRAAHAGNRS
jgi:hypothetical protein